MDPLVSAIAVAIEATLERGIEIKPQGDGWFIRLAPAESRSTNVEAIFGVAETEQTGRSW